jgi:hypothetical protein
MILSKPVRCDEIVRRIEQGTPRPLRD